MPMSSMNSQVDQRKSKIYEVLANQRRVIDHHIRRALALVNFENRVGEENVKPSHRKKFMISPEELYERSFARVSLGNIYRRYRAFYILGLQEALSCLLISETKEDAIEKLKNKLKKASIASRTIDAKE